MSDVIRLVLTIMSDFDEAGMQALVDEELRLMRHQSACSSSASVASCQTRVVCLGGRLWDGLLHRPERDRSWRASRRDIRPESLPRRRPVQPFPRLGKRGPWCRETLA